MVKALFGEQKEIGETLYTSLSCLK